MSMIVLWAAAIAGLAGADSPPPETTPVLELRQYKMVAGKRDTLIALFEDAFIESQEALGIRLVGQFRTVGDPDRFVWLREFPDMEQRGTALQAFYYGPVWQAHRAAANATLDDNDNVLLLRPAAPDLGFQPSPARAEKGARPAPAGLIVATIHYLWKDPGEGFAAFFRSKMMPGLAAAGLPVLGAYVPERTPNNFPRLPVRQHESVFVWFTRVPDARAWTHARRLLDKGQIATGRRGFEERATQTLLLEPTPRSALR